MSIEDLLLDACASIRSRVRRELLGESRRTDPVHALQSEILADGAVRAVLASQDPEGWISRDFHGYDSMESGLRLLCEKDLAPSHASFSRALEALQTMPERLHRGIGKVGDLLDSAGLGGSRTIRASLLAQAGEEGCPQVQVEVPGALTAFEAVLGGDSIEDFVESYRAKLVFRSGTQWPSIYHLRLLAFTHGWRSAEHRRVLAEAVRRLVDWSPLPQIYLRHRSQIIAPASFGMRDFHPDMDRLDDAGWMMWFQRMELLSRLGIAHRVPALRAQIGTLRRMLAENDGRFGEALSHSYFRRWGAYTGLMLEKDWRRARRREYDLTFRSLLIVHYHDVQAS